MKTHLQNLTPVQQAVQGANGETYYIPPKTVRSIPTTPKGQLPKGVNICREPDNK